MTIFAILLLKPFWLRVFFLGIIVSTMLLEYFYFQYFGAFIQPIAFYQFFQNGKETFDVFFDEINVMFIPLLIVIGIFISIIILKKIIQVKSYRNTYIGLGVLLLIMFNSLYKTHKNLQLKHGKLLHRNAKKLIPLPGKHSTQNYKRALNYFLIGILPNKILSNHIETFPILPEPKIRKDKLEDNNIIFIIGESLRAKELGILGYELNTTPNLSSIKNLKYKSIYAAGTMTKTSLSAILNRVKYPGSTIQIIKENNNLFYLAKKMGYNTYFYSWQTNSSLDILQNFIGRKYIDDYASREMIIDRLKTKNRYDYNLVKMLKNIDLNKGKNFIVLHQRGSHAVYKKQYPKKFKKFKKTYDNTVLYTDYVISEIIKYVKTHSKKPTYIIYVSDHGELLHEHGKNGHGWFFEEVYKVPFIYYAINTKTQLPFDNIQSHFDVSNFITYLLGYDTKIKKIKEIYVNGTDIDGLGGYLYIKLDENGNEISIKKIR